ncbi:MAG: hypothetical protein KBD78_15995 [Oligoflexales bacterium]|nr:hypothetical protein [Oligoflexales bacterium]
MHSYHLILALLLFLLAYLYEKRLHTRNFHFLKYLGAEELMPKLMLGFYRRIFLFLPLAALESLLNPWRDNLYNSSAPLWFLGFCFGLILKSWAIHTLGSYWTMSCLAYRGQKLILNGPYRFMQHPEYVGRMIETSAILLLLNGYITVLAYLTLSIMDFKKIISVESRQLQELRALPAT